MLPCVHTPDHRECPECLRLLAELGPTSPQQIFRDAANDYRRYRTLRGTSVRTLAFDRQNMASLMLFFGALRLSEIHAGHVRQYQISRLAGESPFIRRRRPHEEPQPMSAKPKQVNQEIATLRLIMKRARCWTPAIETMIDPVPEDVPTPVRALTPPEQSRWVECARSDPLIYWYSIGAFDTCCSPDEMRGMRLADVRLSELTLTIPARAAKNRFRVRTIPIVSSQCEEAFRWLAARSVRLGARCPEHFLFPFWIGGPHYDPTRPMTASGLKRRWNSVRESSGLTHFRIYDTRHTAITRLAEQGVPVPVIMARAGHVSPRMNQHYTQISYAAQQYWLKKAPSRTISTDFPLDTNNLRA